MSIAPQLAPWTPISLLSGRFNANLSALRSRYPDLADKLQAVTPLQTYSIRPEGNDVRLGVSTLGDVQPLAIAVSPTAARNFAAKLYPANNCDQPVVIAGEDLGWLWTSVYQVPAVIPSAPGHRPPLYFLIRDLERLWVLLHLQDWNALLADPRVRLFAGPDAFAQFRASLTEDVRSSWPKLLARIDAALWPADITIDDVLNTARLTLAHRLIKINSEIARAYVNITPEDLAARITSGSPLKVLGITSRYTTFLQYSMRDWLSAFERLGHRTQLLIEGQDHELSNTLVYAGACAEFKPDLIVVIDHYRREIPGLPDTMPVVMWVQDRLPAIYSPKAGAAQQPLDYTIGYGRVELTQRCGYPPGRFLPTMMAVNENRFVPQPLSQSEVERFRCDVSFVSNATMPADQIIAEEVEKQGTVIGKTLLEHIFGRLRAIYDSGRAITCSEKLAAIIQESLTDNAMTADGSALLDLFTQRVNNSLFRHQAIEWVAEMGVDLRLYGKGWENHPRFARYARGVADNHIQLPAIYRASAINLQVTPFGAVHQRLLDGLAAGGFFLLRSVTADELELLLRDIWNWCKRKSIRNGAEMHNRRDAKLLGVFKRYADLGAVDPGNDPAYFFAAAEESALSGFTRTANTLWENSRPVTFNTREQLQDQVSHFLASPDERQQIMTSMRQRVIETHTYDSITSRMLRFVAADLSASARPVEVSAAA